MKQITVTLNIDEDVILAESGQEKLNDAIDQELGWLHDSGMFVESWFYDGSETHREQQPINEVPTEISEIEPPKIHILCEEYESKDGIREFTILAVSEDEKSLQKLLQAKVGKDEYGFVDKNGGEYESPNHYHTEYEDGFVEYFIVEENLLSQERIFDMLQTDAYKNVHPHVADGSREKQEETITAPASLDLQINLDKLKRYLEDDMIMEFESPEDCLEYFNTYDGQNFKSVDELKSFQGQYGFGLDGKWYHVSFDEALDVWEKPSLSNQIQSASTRASESHSLSSSNDLVKESEPESER